MPPCLLLYSVFGYSVFHAYDVDEIRSERAQRPSATSFSTSLASVRSSSSSLSTPSPLPWTRSQFRILYQSGLGPALYLSGLGTSILSVRVGRACTIRYRSGIRCTAWFILSVY
ncbi:hypothetical protein GW17_00020528 [Ensete ventricosum]|nr:hypothetical protein GW17_00020528 [Ensete ventricosum]